MRLVGTVIGFTIIGLVPPALAYQEAQVSGGGTIKGKVVYKGDIPVRTVVPTKDKDVCGGVREEPEVIVGADNGVGDAIVYLKEVEQGKAWPAGAGIPSPGQQGMRLPPVSPGDSSWQAQRAEFRPCSAQYTRLLRQAKRVSTSPCQTRDRLSRWNFRDPGRSRSTAMRMAGCLASSTSSAIPTMRSRPRTGRSRSRCTAWQLHAGREPSLHGAH